jgi:hypothetical protein
VKALTLGGTSRFVFRFAQSCPFGVAESQDIIPTEPLFFTRHGSQR